MKYYITLILTVTMLICPATAKSRIIPFTVDASQFRHDSAHSIWEMYYSFPDTSLLYVPADGGFIGELYVKAIIHTAQDTAAAQEWVISNKRDGSSANEVKNLVGQKLFFLKPGQYTVSLHIMDINDTASHADSKFPIVIRAFAKTGVSISDVEIVSSFNDLASTQNPAFKKGAINVIPNPAKEYISSTPNLLTYIEIYNPAGDFTVRYTVTDGAKREVFSVERVRQAIADAVAETITLPLDIVPSGAYFIQAGVITQTDSAFTTPKKFYVLNPDMKPEENACYSEDELFLASEFSTMGNDKIQSEFEKAQYAAIPQEIASYNSLTDVKAKQKFLFRFWAARDSDTATTENETLTEFRKQVTYANTYYSNVQIKEGWRTDRGRVRLKYGAPSEVNRVDFNRSGKPYEIWTYNNMQGGNIVFCFVDINGYNNYKLVHSTAIGEVRDERWMDRYVRADNFDPNGDMGR